MVVLQNELTLPCLLGQSLISRPWLAKSIPSLVGFYGSYSIAHLFLFYIKKNTEESSVHTAS